MAMQLRDVEYFAVVAQHGNLGRAAEALGLSQPAISKSLRRLEEELRAKLVKRTAKGVELTPEGSVLLMRIRGLRLSLQDVVREVSDINQGRAGHLRIGAGENVAEYLLPEALGALLEEAPRVTLKVVVSDNDLMLPALRNGELDVVVNYLRLPALPEGLTHEPLYEDETLVCASSHHHLCKRKRTRLTDLVGERWTVSDRGLMPYQWLVQVFEEHGLPQPVTVLESRSSRIRYQALANGNLLDFTSRLAFAHAAERYGLKEIGVKELLRTRPVGIIQRSGAYHSPAAMRFLQILRSASLKIARLS